MKRATRRLQALASRGVRTVADLIEEYPVLPKRSRPFAVWTLGLMDDRRAVPLLIRVYEEESALRGEAAVGLGLLGGKRACEFAVRTLQSSLASPDTSDDSIWDAVLLFVQVLGLHEDALDDPRDLVLLLVEVVDQEAYPPRARAQAAYGLGLILEHSDRRRRRWRLASRALLRALSDEDAQVRLDAVHSVGDMRLTAARPRLTAMARRDTGKTSFGEVATEARGALHAIEHGDWPDWWWDSV